MTESERFQQLVQTSFQYRLQIVNGDGDAVVGYAVLGEVVGANFCGAVAGGDLLAALGGAFCRLRFQFHLE